MKEKPDKKIFNTVIKTLPDPIFIIDEDGTYQNIYGGSDRKKYHDSKSLIGKNFWDFLDREIAEEFYSKLKLALDSNETVTHVYSLSINDLDTEIDPGEPGPSGKMWFEAHITPLGRIKKRKRLVAWVTFNITERYNLNYQLQIEKEALKEANNTKDKLFSIIAHDLINPFSSFQNMLEIIVNKYDQLEEARIKEYLKETLNLAKSNNELLQNLLNWSRVQRKKINLKIENVDLYKLVEENTNFISSNASDKKIKITNKVLQDTHIQADENLLSLVIRNLVSNAVKFTYNEGNIEVSHERKDNKDILKVKDNGVGMDETTMNNIFNHEKVNSTNGTNYEKGSGLGLMLCKEFVEMHKGKIWAESAPGKGSVFYISLPANGNSY
jgi:signal transduction histidine kinase